jgi:hypothetical protein
MRSPVSLPPPVQHSEPRPPLEQLLQQSWSESVCQTYERLYMYDRLAASNYLYLQQRLDNDLTTNRSVRMELERLGRPTGKAIRVAVLAVFHNYQQPLSAMALQSELRWWGLSVECDPVNRAAKRLVEEGELQRFANPFKGNQYVYCSSNYCAKPKLGDRVVELIRKRTHRAGVVERFRVYRMNGQLYPVIRWQNGLLTFGNPDMLFVVERSEPFMFAERRRVV